ncbi:hypothetical protein BH10CHL1_BH10CHL1_06940 [soil metagenome]
MQNPNLPPQNQFFSELDLKVYARIIWHWCWLLVLCTVIAGVGGYVISIFSVPIYQASTTLLVNQARNSATTDMSDLMLSERLASTYAQLMKRGTMLTKVATELKVDPQVFSQALTGVTVTPVQNTQLLRLDVEGTSPQLVAAVAYTLPRIFSGEIKLVQSERFAESKTSLQGRIQDLSNQIEQKQVTVDKLSDSHTPDEGIELNRLRNQLTQLQSTYTGYMQNLENINLMEVQSSDTISIVEPPQIPTTPIRPRIFNNTLLAMVMGAMLALGIVFLIEYLDDRIKTPQDVYNVIDIPLLGTIGRIVLKRNKRPQNEQLTKLEQSLITILEPRHPTTEAYRSLRTNLQFSSIDSALDSLLITSASPGEGKTTTAANLAIVIAQSGRSVLLVDADLRKPRQHQFFNLSQSPGLTEALIASDVAPSNYVRATLVPNLSVLTSGKIPPNPAELLGSHRMQQLIEQLHADADLIIFDAPPVLAVTDAQVLASQVKGVLLVIDSEQTRRATLARAAEALLRTQTRLLGAVLNRLVHSPRGYYYYDAYSNYYTDKVEVLDEAQAKAGKQIQAPERANQTKQNLLNKDGLPQPATNGVYKIRHEQSDV